MKYAHPLGPNAVLIGKPGSRARLNTPCLVLDLPRLKENIATAATYAKTQKVGLRPHAKSHKSVNIAALQTKAGAIGICTATVGEAEVLAAGGIRDILITSALTQPSKHQRAAALAKSGCRLLTVASDPGMVDALDEAARKAGAKIGVLVDIELGRKRNGVTSADEALAVAARIAASQSLTLKGVQGYASHISHVRDYAERLTAAQHSAERILEIKRALEAVGHTIEIVTGGSTGTLMQDPSLHCYTDLQGGSYVFNDAEYMSVDLDGRYTRVYEPSLFVRVSVIGNNIPGRVTCDGGNKHFSAVGTLPVFTEPPVSGARYRPDSDEHGIIELPDGATQPTLGRGFELIVPHCDPTLNLYDHLHVVDEDALVDIWPIEARGAF